MKIQKKKLNKKETTVNYLLDKLNNIKIRTKILVTHENLNSVIKN